MNKIKILALETHYQKIKNGDCRTHGVDQARIINPMKELAKNKDFEVDIRKDPFTTFLVDWDSVTKYYDFIYFSYVDNPVGFANMGLMAMKNNCTLVADLDDALDLVPQGSNVYKTYHPGSKALYICECILQEVAHLTTTNQHLKYHMVDWLKVPHSKVKVFPNYIDLSFYDFKVIPDKTKDNSPIVIQFFGTSTHVVDIMSKEILESLDKILAEFPNVTFDTCGMFLPQLKTRWGKQYTFHLGEPDVDKWATKLWPELMSEADICIAPLKNTEFSKCKSSIKFLEISAAKKPGVYADIRQYREMEAQSPGCCLLADSLEGWYRQLKKLVQSKQLREEMGQKAYNLVKDNYQVKDHVESYASYFKSIKPSVFVR